jgi:hypothetical protein
MPEAEAKRLERNAAAICWTLAFALSLLIFTRKSGDWTTCYLPAGQRALAGEDVFQNGYVYPPLFAWLAAPFTLMPKGAAQAAWYFLNAVALGAMLHLSWRLAGGGKGLTSWQAFGVFSAGMAAGIYYAVDALTNQQTDLFIAALVLAGAALLARGANAAGGSIFGLAAALKCTPLLWSPWLAMRGRWLAAGLVAAVAVGANLAPDLSRPSSDGEWRLVTWANRYLAPMGEAGRDPGEWASAINFNHSVAGVSLRWSTATLVRADGAWKIEKRIGRPTAKALKFRVRAIDLTLFALAAAAAFVARRRRGAGERAVPTMALETSLVLILMVMLSPMSSKPHFCTLVLPGLCLAREVVAGGRRELAIPLALATICGLASNRDLAGRAAYEWAVWNGSVFANALFLFGGCITALLLPFKPPSISAKQSADTPGSASP